MKVRFKETYSEHFLTFHSTLEKVKEVKSLTRFCLTCAKLTKLEGTSKA